MAANGGQTPIRSLEETPTWALATVCLVFISISLFIEHLIHLLGHWLKKRRKNALFEAVQKLKSVLMLLGFMSLILTVTGKSITKICIPSHLASSMLPCHRRATKTVKNVSSERILAGDQSSSGYSSSDYCGSKGKASLISEDGINQLNIFLFVLAVMQIVYSVITLALGRAKMRRWEAWERETQTVEYQAANDPNRFRYTRQTTFGRRHMSFWTTTSLQLWIMCFFRQFFNSVAKVDYLTLRHGFIAAHLQNNNYFNFQKYIQRSLEDDFKVVVGISPFMWFFVVIFLLADVHGWHVYLWVSFLPLTIVLILGTKLEVVVAKLALRLKGKGAIIKGAPLVQPNDDLFWFNHPKFVLTLLHYTLFMNAFEIAFIVWTTLQFGINSCYHERLEIIITRVVLAVTVQVMCSYITLPLYALVTQMGSQFKSAVLEKQTANIILQWHAEVKKKNKKKKNGELSPSNSSFPSPVSTTHRTISSPDFYSHNQAGCPDSPSHIRAPTFAESSQFSTGIQIVEGRQEIVQEVVHPPLFINSNRPETTEPHTWSSRYDISK